uniref:TUFA_0 protein n=1 Tax=Fopius arisanus TaxID=64838 RepID=A0A0C9QFA3_9HYME
MKSCKNSIRMPIPETYLAFQELTETEEWERIRTYDEGRLNVRCVTAANGQSALVVGDTALPQSIPNFTCLHVVSTSAIQPRIENTRNVIAFVAEWRDHACLFAIGLVNDVSEQLINAILTDVKEQFLPRHQLTSITTLFDWKWRDAARNVFEGITIKLTFEQYCSTVLHHARHVVDLDNPLHEQVLYKLICVALEFPGSMIECFNVLWESMSHELIAAFLPLLSWYLNVLLMAIRPEQLSLANNFTAFHVVETKIRVILTHRRQRYPVPLRGYSTKNV